MNWSDFYLLCFGVGSLWSFAALLMGGMHLGHGSHGHGHGHAHAHGNHAHGHMPGWLGMLLTPSCIAVFLAWFGGIGYLLTRHSAFGLWIDLGLSALVGLFGAFLLAVFLRWLLSHEKPLEETETDLIGMFGNVSATIRSSGVGEMIFVRDGSRRALPARSEDGNEITRGEEVVITRIEKGTAFVRTWAALTQPETDLNQPGNSANGD